jgi:hypothetical protein
MVFLLTTAALTAISMGKITPFLRLAGISIWRPMTFAVRPSCMPDVAVVFAAVGFRHEQRDVFTHYFLTLIAEDALSRRTEFGDGAVGIYDYNAASGRIYYSLETGGAVRHLLFQLCLGLFKLSRLSSIS